MSLGSNGLSLGGNVSHNHSGSSLGSLAGTSQVFEAVFKVQLSTFQTSLTDHHAAGPEAYTQQYQQLSQLSLLYTARSSDTGFSQQVATLMELLEKLLLDLLAVLNKDMESYRSGFAEQSSKLPACPTCFGTFQGPDFNQILGFFAYIMTQLSQEEIDYDTIDTDALDELIEDAGDLFADLDGPTTLDPTMVLPYSPLSQDGLSRFQMDLTMSLSQTLMSVDEDADDLFGDDDDDDSFMDFSNFFGSDVVSTDSDTGYVSFDLVTYLSQSSG